MITAIGACMKFQLISEYFLNEYFQLNKSYTFEDIKTVFAAKSENCILNYTFKNSDFLFEAFTHTSFAHESKLEIKHNENLEFLGDSVLQLMTSEILLAIYPHKKEGELSKLRSSIVNEQTLAKLARCSQFQNYILLGKGEFKEKGYEKESLMANVFEAVLGAIYLDSGSNLNTVKDVFSFIVNKYENKEKINVFSEKMVDDFDAKSKLQELTMAKYKEIPKYIATPTKDNKSFDISVQVQGKNLATINHISKKKGMQLLAKQILDNQSLSQ